MTIVLHARLGSAELRGPFALTLMSPIRRAALRGAMWVAAAQPDRHGGLPFVANPYLALWELRDVPNRLYSIRCVC